MNMKKTFYLSRKPSGFILVEVIVSISILMLAIPAALTVASKSVFLAAYSKDQVIATYLAQEGIEIIRNRRDQNILRGGLSWTDGFWAGDCKKGLQCIVDFGPGVSDPTITKCVGLCSFVLNVDTVSGAYSHQIGGTWVPTKFSRYIQTDDVPCGGSGAPNPDEMCVISVVTYLAGGIIKTVTMTDNLTSWIR